MECKVALLPSCMQLQFQTTGKKKNTELTVHSREHGHYPHNPQGSLHEAKYNQMTDKAGLSQLGGSGEGGWEHVVNATATSKHKVPLLL